MKIPSKKLPLFFAFSFLVFFTFFVLLTLSPKMPEKGSSILFYSNQCRQDLLLTLIKALEKAKSSIHLVMFGLTDKKVIKTLQEKSKQGISVTIYYDPYSSFNLSKTLPFATIRPIRHKGLMHQKIVVIDHSMVFIGSANMTPTSLCMHDNLVLGFESEEIAQFLEEKTPLFSGHIEKIRENQHIELWLLPDVEKKALEGIKKHLRSAQSSIRLAMFTLTHPSLVDELIKAKNRGVKVMVALDAQSSIGASHKAYEKLTEEKIPVFISQGPQLFHHKFLLIDEETLVCGSANWTKAAFQKNHDCFLTLYPLELKQKKFMNNLWHIIECDAKR